MDVSKLKSLVKRGLRWGYLKLRNSPWLLNLVRRYLPYSPRLEGLVRRVLSAKMVESPNYDEEALTDEELKALMDIKDAIAASLEGAS
jgi:hypothetical protein